MAKLLVLKQSHLEVLKQSQILELRKQQRCDSSVPVRLSLLEVDLAQPSRRSLKMVRLLQRLLRVSMQLKLRTLVAVWVAARRVEKRHRQ